MSSERGNPTRSRAQKHKNTSAFRNNMHDNSTKQKSLNALTFDDTCDRCSQILQWKVQYRKYKPLNHLKKCTKCLEPTVKLAYRIVCQKCAEKDNICPKCCQPVLDFQPNVVTIQTISDLGPDMLKKLRALPERCRRQFERLVIKGKPPVEAAEAVGGSDIPVPQINFWTQEELMIRLDALELRSLKNHDEFNDSDSDSDVNYSA